MKRFWIGIAIMSILLLLGMGSSIAMDRIHTPIARHLEQAGEAAAAGHWQEAKILTTWAQNRWEKYWNLIACITDHEAMEDADAQFARLAVLERNRESIAFSAGCAGLAALFDALADVQDFNLWNLM